MMAIPKPITSPQFRSSRTIEVNLPDIPLWIPSAARQIIMDLLTNTMQLALQDAAGAVSDEAPRDTGILAQSFAADPANATGGIELLGSETADTLNGRVFSALPYAIVMDQGRRAGAPISRAGIDAIGLWAQRKLGLSADEASRAKWAIASAIVKRGITGTRYFEKGVAAAQPRIEALFDALGTQITQQLTAMRGAEG